MPEGSLLALYTDGLIETRGRDIDAELETLRGLLASPTPSARTTGPDARATGPDAATPAPATPGHPAEEATPGHPAEARPPHPVPLDTLCDTILHTLLPARPEDDVALLLARARSLDAQHIATWDVPDDPAAVAGVRKSASELLVRWGLEDTVFTTELVVSELVTNAIRYGHPPIRLRLIRDRALICEVSDTSSTAPHLRRARTFDEGGRGLLLVAQLTQRWGTRHHREGKTIWAEQDLPGDLPPA
ncbi:ATP-binding protein [Streptomyces sp. NA04227]|nr:ATP-binding protein [Streptomyces sp. NA04227]